MSTRSLALVTTATTAAVGIAGIRVGWWLWWRGAPAKSTGDRVPTVDEYAVQFAEGLARRIATRKEIALDGGDDS